MTLDYFYGQAGELFSFYRIPKALFQEPRFQSLSTDAKTLYGILLDRMSLSRKNGWLDEQGRVFIIFTLEEVMEAIGCADQKATKLLNSVRSSKDPWFYTILAFITPGLPNGIIPYAAANAGMRPKHFIAAIFISLPFPTLLTCAAGSFILEGNWFFTVLTGIVLFSFVGILFFNRTRLIARAHQLNDNRKKKAGA